MFTHLGAGSRLAVWRVAGWLAVLSLVLGAILAPSAIAANPEGPPGNNGTVKIHDGASEPASEVRNEPHVCTFHLHFFFADPAQVGSWWIEKWSPGDKGTVVLSGTYNTNGDGEDRQPEQGVYTLANGHYKLFWQGDTDKHEKMKVFWVDCGASAPTPSGSVEASSSAEASGSVEASSSAEASGSAAASGSAEASASSQASANGSVLPTSTTNASPGGSAAGVESASPTGSVEGAVGTPTSTLPPTDTAGGSSNGAPQGWRLALLVLAALIGSVLVLVPAPKRVRNR